MKKRILSGIQPSGDLHIGNYIGALGHWVRLQDDYETFFCLVDLHAITEKIDPKLKERSRSLIAWYLAAGIDPKKSVIFIQSQNQDHAQLGWILNCFTSMGELSRMTQYKDKKDKAEFVSVGLFDYPVLMAGDIFLYNADLVPVGEDQKQHVELARDIAKRFNSRYGDIFTIPQYMPPPVGARIMSLQRPEKKMSKSASDPLGTIGLKDEPDTIRKKIKSAVTDSEDQIRIDEEKLAISNLVAIFMAMSGRSEEELDHEYSGKGYKKFKEDLAEAVIQNLQPIQERYRQLRESKKELDEILAEGLERARAVSSKTLRRVQDAIGLG